MRKYCLLALILSLAALVACGEQEPEVLRLATTTSTADSGLLDAILPAFEEEHNARVDVVAVGTGQAIELGEAGDADVILVHARAREDAFVAEGHGTHRYDVMVNDFVIVGPAADPAGVAGMSSAADALVAVALAGSPFASRGDDSGTHTKELSLWEEAGVTPDSAGGWYSSLGQGMGESLLRRDLPLLSDLSLIGPVRLVWLMRPRLLGSLKRLKLGLFGDPRSPGTMWRDLLRHSALGGLEALDLGFGGSSDERQEALATLAKVPSLVMVGADDRMTPAQHSLDMARRLPKSVLEIMPDSGHMMILEHYEQVNHQLRALVGRVRADLAGQADANAAAPA